MNPKVGILIVVTNEVHQLPVLFSSIKKQTYGNIDVYMLDNNCDDNSVELAKELYPEIYLYHSDQNLGFALGNNKLAQNAIQNGCHYLFVINPDIELEPNCIQELVKLITSDTNLAVVAPIMFFGLEEKKNNIIQKYASNINFDNLTQNSLYVNEKYIEEDIPQKIIVNTVPGGVTFIKSSVVEEFGLFEESYFIYGEERELSYRVIKAGYKMAVTSYAQTWHHHNFSKTNLAGHYRNYYYQMRNKFIFLKQKKMYYNLIRILFLEIILLPIKIKWALKVADIKLLKYYYIGILHALLNKTGKASLDF